MSPVGVWLVGGIDIGIWHCDSPQVGWVRILMVDRKIADVSCGDGTAYIYLTHTAGAGGTLANARLTAADVNALLLRAAPLVA
jgi:ubiquinone/menaquinone biosynthesis C-methylase UbiE